MDSNIRQSDQTIRLNVQAPFVPIIYEAITTFLSKSPHAKFRQESKGITQELRKLLWRHEVVTVVSSLNEQRCSAKPGDQLTLQPGLYEATTGTTEGGRSNNAHENPPKTA
jgi:hypothetical protein